MAGLPSNSNALQQWHHLFEAQGEQRSPQAHEHLQQVLRLGLPTRKDEDWKYTALDGLLNSQFVAPKVTTLEEIAPDSLALTVDAWRLVFVDGQFAPGLSDSLEESGFHVTINNVRDGLPAPVNSEIFLHLTESLAATVTHIRVAHNQRPAKPLLLMHITRGLAGDEMNTAHYRHHIALESGAEATVLEHYVSLNEQRHFTGARFTMDVADNAHLHHLKLGFENPQSYHFAHNDIFLGQDASAHSSSFLLGASVTRHHTSTRARLAIRAAMSGINAAVGP